MKVKDDHRSKFSNLSNWKAEAWKIQQAPVPENFVLFLYLPSYALSRVKFYAIITESRSKDTKVFCKLK